MGTTIAGLEGVIAGESEICYIDGYLGTLSYRGYNIHTLADNAIFEEVIFLLWNGWLPKQGELDQLKLRRWLPVQGRREGFQVNPESHSIPRTEYEDSSEFEVVDATFPGKASKLQVMIVRTANRHWWVRGKL
jgi:citrate synthase